MVKAIETTWNGYRFRSRLEARWAIWLANLGIRYQYEMQGFVLDDEPYLPDFWLPFSNNKSWDQGSPPVCSYWLEIKPTAPTDRELRLLQFLARDTGHHAYLFAGNCWPGEFAIYTASVHGDQPKLCQPCVCPWCHGTGIDPILKEMTDQGTWEGSQDCWCSRGSTSPEQWIELELYGFFCNLCRDNESPARSQWRAAFRAAREARFEHGEPPR